LGSNTPNPVIIKETTNGHFVLATGFATNAGTSTYTVRDSAWYNTQYLNQSTSTDTSSTVYGYANDMDGIRIYYDPPALPLQAEYHVNLPNGIILVDSRGRRTGKDPASGTIYREIPGTSYAEDCLSTNTNCAGELFTNNVPDGQYTFYVLGGVSGKYGLSAYNNRGLSRAFRGNIQRGTMIAYTQQYDAANFANSSPVFEGITSSTRSITSEPPDNLPLPVAHQRVAPAPTAVAPPATAPIAISTPSPASSSLMTSSSSRSVSTSSISQ
jgi:hypothetical protein